MTPALDPTALPEAVVRNRLHLARGGGREVAGAPELAPLPPALASSSVISAPVPRHRRRLLRRLLLPAPVAPSALVSSLAFVVMVTTAGLGIWQWHRHGGGSPQTLYSPRNPLGGHVRHAAVLEEPLSCHPDLDRVDFCEQCPASLCQDDCVVRSDICVLKTWENLEESVRIYQSDVEKMRKWTVRATTEGTVEEVYRTARLVVETLTEDQARGTDSKARGKWFAYGGTLIGAMRCRPPGMMKWDDDMDLAVLGRDDLEAVHSVLSANPHLEWKRHPQFMAYKYRHRGGSGKRPKWQYDLDVFGLERNGSSSKWHSMDPFGREVAPGFKHEWFEDEEVKSTVPCKFWDLTLSCPVGSESYLRRSFGEDMDRVAYVHRHIMELGEKPVRFNMTSENLNQQGLYFPAMTRELMDKLVFGDRGTGEESG